MSYDMIEELPPQVRKSFTYADAGEWMYFYNMEMQRLDGTLPLDERVDQAYLNAWISMETACSSRSFKAQVVVEAEDVQGETPIVSEYTKLAISDMIRDGGIGMDKHSSKNVWTIWDVTEATDIEGRPSIVIKGNFFRDKPMFDIAWDLFLRGRSQFSLGSYTRRNRVCDTNFKCIIEVLPAQWFEISIVDVGASPNTGVISIHVPKGEGDFNPKNMVTGTTISLKDGENFCPIRYAFEGMKERITLATEGTDDQWSLSWIEDFGAIYQGSEENSVNADYIITDWSEGVFAPSIRLHDIDDFDIFYIFMVPHSYFTALDETDIATLIIDEEEAIIQYDEAIEKAKRLGEDNSADIVSALEHIRDEEIEHISELHDIVYLFYEPITEPTEIDDYPDGITLKNRPGDMTNVRNCPAGQHSHSGIEGCHDITRAHDFEKGSAPEGKIDVTDEHIDIDGIKSTNTRHLSNVVKTIAKALTSFSDDKVKQFMESSGGKEFALMLTELVNRKREAKGSDNVKEETKVMHNVSEKMDNDPASELASLITVIADIKTKVEHLTTLVMDAKSSALEGTSQSGNIADAVSTAVDSISDSDGVDLGETAVGNADGSSATEGSTDSEGAFEGEVAVEGESGESDGGEPPVKGEGDAKGDKPDFGGEEESKKDESDGEGKGDGAEGGESAEGGEESGEEPTKEKPKGDEEKDEKKVKEATGISEVGSDPMKADEEEKEPVKRDEGETGVSEKANVSSIPTVPCDAPGVVEGVPNIGGEGAIVGGMPGGVDSASSPAPSDVMVSTKGVSIDSEVPPAISQGPIGAQLEAVSKTKPVESYEATTVSGLEGWVAISKGFLGEGVSMKVDNNPLETTVSLKSTDAGVLIITPETVGEGTGLNRFSEKGAERELEKLWKAIGSDSKTFSEVKKEVLQ